MAKGTKRKAAPGDIATNRQASYRYHLLDKLEAGMVLTGTEVKSLREGKAQLKDGYAAVQNGEVWLYNVHIPPYGPAIVQLAIRGEDPHDLRLVPAGKARSSARPAAVPETLPGAVAEWRGKLTKGKWTLYCSLPGHKQAGMRATLAVR